MNVLQVQLCDMLEPNILKLLPVVSPQDDHNSFAGNKVAILFDKLFGYVVIGLDCCFDGL